MRVPIEGRGKKNHCNEGYTVKTVKPGQNLTGLKDPDFQGPKSQKHGNNMKHLESTEFLKVSFNGTTTFQ